MNQPDYDAALSYALDRLRNELPPTLLYHDFRHTAEDVLPAAERLAALEGVGGEDLQLLRVSAAYHDVGYIEAYWQHELASLRVAAQTLPDFGLAPQQINRVLGMIVATRLPQSPRDLLEQIMADADLDSLGREDYFEMSERLRQELELRGQPRPLHQWQEVQITFLRQHGYFTEAARQLRQATKDRNLASLEIRLRADGSSSSPL
jgi:predicted metal-dependent HD superfamily phosphohydrolase